MPYRGEGAPLTGGAPVTVPRDAARDAAKQELLNPAYHRHDPSLVQRAMKWVGDRLDDLLTGLGHPLRGGTAGVLLAVVLVLGLLAVLWWRYGTPHRRTRSADTLFTRQGPRTAAEHRAAATAHAAADQWADAVREQMRALVRSLEERTLLDHRPGRTADEAAAEAARVLPEHAAALADAARTFDDIAFGDRAADRAAYLTLADLDRKLQATRPTLAGAAPVPVGGAAA
ncbi:DUF4129 domain-containing protein [Kitasatospora cinereorecta]|uniref:DUF4129 domain-containing protein n=1 Tax=Kitasatospora cinereorecta TaxID=285560 RepID=A0ABW0VQ34_9ACTN